MKHAIRMSAIVLGVTLTLSTAWAADGMRMLQVGSWAEYSYKVVDAPAAPVADAPKAAPAAAAPSLPPEMLAMLANLPPDQRAAAEAQMSASFAQAAAQSGAAGAKATQGMDMQGIQNGGNSMVDEQKKEMFKMMDEMDMKVRFSVTSEEKRGDQAYYWFEVRATGKLPDLDAMWKNTEKKLRAMNVPEADIANSKTQMDAAKEQMLSMPIATKDGKINLAMKLLVKKPTDMSSADLVFEPFEIIERKGDGAPRAYAATEVKKFNDNNKGDIVREREQAGVKAGSANMLGRIPGLGKIPGMAAAAAAGMISAGAIGNVGQAASSVSNGGGGIPVLVKMEMKPFGYEDKKLTSLGAVHTLRLDSTKETVIKITPKAGPQSGIKAKMRENKVIDDAAKLTEGIEQKISETQKMWVSPAIPGIGMGGVETRTVQTVGPNVIETMHRVELIASGDKGAKSAF